MEGSSDFILRHNFRVTGIKTLVLAEMDTGAAEQSRKDAHTKTALCFLAEVQKQFSGVSMVFSVSGVGTIGHPYAKKKKKKEYCLSLICI